MGFGSTERGGRRLFNVTKRSNVVRRVSGIHRRTVEAFVEKNAKK
jgi:hypothetical protein